ncbi:hypothetical protein J5N97_028860 [Dioscorea zingiberensis]|uniref:Uncharacterized protein n=1 Tax=Dioscorea zingiberensis TaxID=325984 RepID=A0A9D5H5B0_9LILI|nr:hypothetical protein J5N97_028860 [Dioscorea zingiberensis]
MRVDWQIWAKACIGLQGGKRGARTCACLCASARLKAAGALCAALRSVCGHPLAKRRDVCEAYRRLACVPMGCERLRRLSWRCLWWSAYLKPGRCMQAQSALAASRAEESGKRCARAECGEAALGRLFNRAWWRRFQAARQGFVGDVVMLKDPENPDDYLVRRFAAIEGYEMASRDEKDEPFVLEKDQCSSHLYS